MGTVLVQGQHYELASLWERWLGQLLDGLIYFAIFFGPGVLLSFLVGPMVVYFGFAAAVFYLFFQDGLSDGRSLGKRMLGTKVIDAETGNPCGFGQSFVRNVLLVVLNWIDWIFIFGQKRQRLGDKAAQTYVVKQDAVSLDALHRGN